MEDSRVKLKESEKRDKSKRTKNTLENKGDSDTNCNWCAWNNTKNTSKGTVRPRNKRTSGDCSIIKISPNTGKSSGDFRQLALTQTQEESHQLTLF